MDLSPLSAASGLVKMADRVFVIGDDDLSLYEYSYSKRQLVQKIQLITGILPTEKKLKKKMKPDFESLTLLPDLHSLLAVPSGSTSNRESGFIIHLESSKVEKISFSELYHELRNSIVDLNIEGSLFQDGKLCLFQRGNGRDGMNAIIRVEFDENRLGSIESIREFNLGSIQNYNYGFTDACLFEREIYFLAVAEQVYSTYEDGPFLGAILGSIDRHGNVRDVQPFNIDAKPEGLWIENERSPSESRKIAYIVTDADDPAKPARMVAVPIS